MLFVLRCGGWDGFFGWFIVFWCRYVDGFRCRIWDVVAVLCNHRWREEWESCCFLCLCFFVSFPPNNNQEIQELGIFQSSYSQSNHHKWYFYINKGKIFYNLIEPHNYFPQHKTVVTNSTHFPFTYTPQLIQLQSGVYLESICIWKPVVAVGYLHGGALS